MKNRWLGREATRLAVQLAAIFFLAALVAGCGAKKAAAPPEFPWQAALRSDFVMGPQGLEPLLPGEIPLQGRGVESPLALRAAALSAAASGGRLVAALNRFGLAIFSPSPDGKAYKLRNLAVSEMGAQSVAGLWPRGEGWLLELNRNPFSAGLAPRSDFAPELLSLSPDGKVTVLPRLGKPGEDLFALFPGPGRRWFAEFREEGAMGAKLRYSSLGSPEAGTGASELRRDIFEAALAPRPLASAPASLRKVAQALGIQGILVHAKGAGGSDGYWLDGGLPEEAIEAYAWLSSDEGEAVIILRSGMGAWSEGRQVWGFNLEPPLPGAGFSGIAALFPPRNGSDSGKAGLMSASWESGAFPAISASGISVQALPVASPPALP